MNKEMNVLQSSIHSLTQKISYLEQDTIRLQNSNKNDLIQIKKYQNKINQFLLSHTMTATIISKPILLKTSLKNEELLTSYLAKVQSIISSKESLINLAFTKDFSFKQSTNNDCINNLKASINKLDKDIIIHKKMLQNEFNHMTEYYITEPTKASIDKMNELLIHKELSNKFEERSIKLKTMIIDTNKLYDSLLKELKELKESKGIKEVIKAVSLDSKINCSNGESGNSADIDNQYNESIGSIDSQCIYNIDSPRFLTKVKQCSKIDFAFENNLKFNCFKRQITSNNKAKKSQNNNNVIAPMHSSLINKKKITAAITTLGIGIAQGTDNKQSSKSTNWKNSLSIEHKPISIEKEIIQTKKTIKEMMKKLSEELYQNRLLFAKKNEVCKKIEKIKKKIGNFERIIIQLEHILNTTETAKTNNMTKGLNEGNDDTVDYEGIGLRNQNLFPTPLYV